MRDRAALYLKVFGDKPLADTYVKEGQKFSPFSISVCSKCCIVESVFSLAALESKLVAYVKDVSASAKPFDVSSIPRISRAQAAQDAARAFAVLCEDFHG